MKKFDTLAPILHTHLQDGSSLRASMDKTSGLSCQISQKRWLPSCKISAMKKVAALQMYLFADSYKLEQMTVVCVR